MMYAILILTGVLWFVRRELKAINNREAQIARYDVILERMKYDGLS